MTEQGFPITYSQQSMGHPAVPDKHLWRFHQSFFCVGMPGHQAPHQQQIHQQVQVTGHGFPVHGKTSCQLGRIQQGSLSMGQHGPKTTQGFRRDARTEQWNVSFQIGANEIFTPDETPPVVHGQEAVRKTTPQPELFLFIRPHFKHMQRGQFDIGDTAGETFPRLAHEINGGRAQQQKLPCPAPRSPALINQTP